MLTFFLTIIIVYVFWLVVRPLAGRLARRYFQRKAEDFFRNAYGVPPTGNSANDRTRSAGKAPKRRRKIFSADEGEYIEFQEITVDSSTEYTSTTYSSTTYTPHEPRISDAEWEDL